MQAPADQHHRCRDPADEQHLQSFGRALLIAGEVGAEGLQRVVGHYRIGRQKKPNDLKGVGVHNLGLRATFLDQLGRVVAAVPPLLQGTVQSPEQWAPGFGEWKSELPALASWGHGIQRGLQKPGGT